MPDEEAAAAPAKGGRYGLPGIPSYIDRVSQEKIYADKIIGENNYFDECRGVFVFFDFQM